MYHHYINPQNFHTSFQGEWGIADIVSFISNIITIAGVIGLWIAYQQYKNRQIEENRKHLKETLRAIRSVKYQLEVIGNWTGFSNGGYHMKDRLSWIAKERNIRGNPFHSIFEVEYSSLKDLNILPAIEYFSDEINEAIAWMKQWIASFNATIRDIKKFAYSRNAENNVTLHLKLNKAIKSKLTIDEKTFVSKLLEMYTSLHFDIIGDETTGKLHFWHKKLKTLLDNLEKDTQQKLRELG